MNLILLRDEDFAPDGTALLRGRRLEHVRTVLKPKVGETLTIGRRGGLTGTGKVLASSRTEVVLEAHLDQPPPPRAGIDLLLAVPRPKALKKVLPAIASLGVDRLVLINAARVEKSYFDSKVLEPSFFEELIDLGLEQAKDTVPPQLLVKPLFKPFVEDEMPALLSQSPLKLLPHPPASAPLPARAAGQRVALAVGPEGGWVPFEVQLLERHGFQPVSLGPRTLRVEVAVPAIIGALR